MKILLTGATGYIGKRLLPILVDAGHEVVCCVRDVQRFSPPRSIRSKISVIEIDLLEEDSLQKIPKDINGAYYLVHSMSASANYAALEKQCAIHFRQALRRTQVEQVIYLSGIINEEDLSPHLASRKMVEKELDQGDYSLTTLRSGIIIGSGSASFEIIRDLVEKLPVMIAPKWLNTKCQPIGIADVLAFLAKALFDKRTYDQNFDIGGPDVLSYQEMLLGFAQSRGLKRTIFTVPVMTPRLSSYWLYFVTSTSYKLAVSLVNSMKVEVVCRDNRINAILTIEPVSYQQALQRAFDRIKNNEIISSWKDSYSSSGISFDISDFTEVPTYGCFIEERQHKVSNRLACIDRIWRIGGKTGWYYATILWKLRGFLDKMVGGVGLRRGRTNSHTINVGDAVDFWRVLYADREEGRLLLFAEMKLPGEAWLEFKLVEDQLLQTATFRPLGLWGRLYWYAVLPFHGLIFSGMLRNIARG
ncbi:MAG: SDR family oxidoreductase [Bacteroidota bacterium]